MILDSPDYKVYSIYKLNKSLLNKLQHPTPLTGPNGLVLEATDKVELMSDFLEWQFTTYPGPDILDVTKIVNNVKNLKITK